MPAAKARTTRHSVNLRMPDQVREVIDRAAHMQGRSRSDFMIDASRRAAEEALLDQTSMRVDAKTFAHFVEVLDKPPSGDGYQRLMSAPKPWAS